MPSIVLRTVSAAACEDILPLLRDADEDEARIRSLVTDGVHTAYAAWDRMALVGAVLIHWASDASEIEYIAVASDMRGRGYGKAMIAQIFVEAHERAIPSILVGTGNNSWDTIAFYQKCGFRMDHVRRNFFSYIQPPLVIDNIPLLDMLVLRYLVVETEIR